MTDINQVKLPVQENWRFIDELKKTEKRFFVWTRQNKQDNELDLRPGVTLVQEFPGAAQRLETAYADWQDFLKEGKIPANGSVSLILRKGESGPYDSFVVEITKNSIMLSAQDVEGIRRGIFYVEDLLLAADGPFLKTGTIRRDCWLKNRISRCFFGPIKRPPMNRDELMDKVNYYPDAYLSRLAHEGVNGLWLTVEFKELCRTDFTPDAAPDSEKRLAKLRRRISGFVQLASMQ